VHSVGCITGCSVAVRVDTKFNKEAAANWSGCEYY
jgi:hypothetical protein